MKITARKLFRISPDKLYLNADSAKISLSGWLFQKIYQSYENIFLKFIRFKSGPAVGRPGRSPRRGRWRGETRGVRSISPRKHHFLLNYTLSRHKCNFRSLHCKCFYVFEIFKTHSRTLFAHYDVTVPFLWLMVMSCWHSWRHLCSPFLEIGALSMPRKPYLSKLFSVFISHTSLFSPLI